MTRQSELSKQALVVKYEEMNVPALLLIISSVVISSVVVALLLRKWLQDSFNRNQPSTELLSWLQTTNQRMDEQSRHIADTLSESTKSLNERLDNAARFIAVVQKNIGEMSEIGRDMKQLQELLRSPKLRGNVGEHILAELLSQMMPKQSFLLQHTFHSGVTVDVAIKTSNGMIPVDAKFPLENFRRLLDVKDDKEKDEVGKEFVRDVKRHVDAIEKKYILPDEGTMDYALMYIPSEAIYYEVVNRPDLYDYAALHRVLPVSPMTFYAYLRAILMSFEGQKIEQEARQILITLRAMRKDYSRVEEHMNVLQRHVTNAFNQMNNVMSSFSLLGQKLTTTMHLDEEKEAIEPPALP